jgi:serine/threonine protein kinase
VQDFMYRMLLQASLDTPHENFVRYLDFLEGPDHFFVVMEQLEGNDLLGKVEADHPFEEAYVRKTFQQVLLALAHLHGTVGLAHRDVKLANFRFRAGSESGLALLDLQFCCPVDADWDQQACGTPALMAPEVTAKSVQKGLLQATDVWSAGVIFFRLMAKDFPFADQQEMDVVSKLGPDAAALVDRAVSSPKLAGYSDEARDLLRALLTLEAGLRPTAKQALEHAYFG